MANTYTCLHYHVVFSTKHREPWLEPEIRGRLFPYLSAAARDHGVSAVEVGGVADHVHVLLRIPPSLTLSKSVQFLKGGSSHWMKDTFRQLRAFAWQDGYGAFTVSRSQVSVVQRYIQNQEEHHRTRPFAEEFRALLETHQIEYDERYLLG